MGRTEDAGSGYNNNFVVVPSAREEEPVFEDLNGFKITLPKGSFKYTMIPDVEEHGDGIYGETGMNEYGVSMSATVSAGTNGSVSKFAPGGERPAGGRRPERGSALCQNCQ